MAILNDYDKFHAIYNSWLNDPHISDEDKDELRSIADDKDEIIERFYRALEFGTAGLRGILGIGANRMNKYIVSKATQGYANYLLKDPTAKEKGVVIAFDSRIYSSEFALETALVLSANGIKSYLYDGMRSVPQLSYSITRLGCIGGIVITASHNPSKYNGYKVYSHTGAQIPPEIASEVLNSIESITSLSEVKRIGKDEAIAFGVLEMIGADIDKEYISYVKSLSINPDLFDSSSISIVYTPLHGTGSISMPQLFSSLNMKNIHYVDAQMAADGRFPTVSAPNPEASDAFDMAKALGKDVNAPLLLATDPDSDRLGVCVRNKAGDYIALSGNQIGALMLDYILSSLSEKKSLPENGFAVRSMVSTQLADKIAKNYGIEMKVVNTGFRFIGELVYDSANNDLGKFIFGFEESFGYLYGTMVRDKDAICAAMFLVEMALYYSKSGITLLDALDNIYKKYGYFVEKVKSIELEGIEGQQKISETMAKIRSNPPIAIAGMSVERIKDYSSMTIKNASDGSVEKFTESISGNIIIIEMAGGNWLCIRPSGTEPKIKIYASIVADSPMAGEAVASETITDFTKYLGF